MRTTLLLRGWSLLLIGLLAVGISVGGLLDICGAASSDSASAFSEAVGEKLIVAQVGAIAILVGLILKIFDWRQKRSAKMLGRIRPPTRF